MLYFRQKTFKKIPFMSLFEKTDKLSCLKFLICTWKQLFILAWKKLTRLVLDVFWIWLCCFLHWKNISQSLFGKHTYFSICYCMFFYTQRVFAFHLQRGLYAHIVGFFIFLLWKGFIIYHKTSQSFFVILVVFSWWIFLHFYICEKKSIKFTYSYLFTKILFFLAN